MLVGGEVPGEARLVPLGVCGGEDLPVEEVAEDADAGNLLCGDGERGGHFVSSG